MIIGLGTDVAQVNRFDFDADAMDRFAKKVFTAEEIAHAMRYRHRAERLAGAFAAKEAARKAFGHAIPWRQVGVRHERTGKPYIELSGAAQRLVAMRGVRRMHVTVSHSRESAVATVILEGDDVAGGVVAEPISVTGEAAR